jgi:hypothetical protein
MFGVVQRFVAKRASTQEDRALWTAELARLQSILATLPTDLEKVSFLRTYSGALIGLGLIDLATLSDRVSRLYRTVNFHSFDPGTFFLWFKNHIVPAECGLTSFFYIKLLQSFGFKAYQYTFGFREAAHRRCVHSVALVEIVFEGMKRLIVQDAYLNLTYRSADGKPMDFIEFLSTIKQRQYDLIAVDSAPVITFLLVPDVALYDRYLNDKCKQLMLQALRQPDGRIRKKLPITRDYATLMQSPCDNLEEAFLAALRDHGYPEPFLYAYTLRAGDLVGERDHKQVQDLIDSVIGGRQPVTHR